MRRKFEQLREDWGATPAETLEEEQEEGAPQDREQLKGRGAA